MHLSRCLPILPLLVTPAAAQVFASYDAGAAGNPTVAPDPTTQGWTLVDPSGGQVLLTDVSPDGATGLNAWQVDDQVTFNGGRAHYAKLCDAGELASIAADGFEYELEMRMLDGFSNDIFFEFATGTAGAAHRYLIMFAISGADVLANDALSGNSLVCAGGFDGNYHTFTIRRGPEASGLDAEFLFDGNVIGTLFRANSNGNAPNGGVHWGSGSSNATGTANVHRVSFKIPEIAIGSSYCSPAVSNSTGGPAVLAAFGNADQANGPFAVRLRASGVPPNEFGYFVGGMNQGFIPGPGGSQGNLCLSIPLARFIAACRAPAPPASWSSTST